MAIETLITPEPTIWPRVGEIRIRHPQSGSTPPRATSFKEAPASDDRDFCISAMFGYSEPINKNGLFTQCRRTSMLQLRPNCECCNKDLPPETSEARICSFECTFCASCTDMVLKGCCPNCGGELVVRPRRPADKLAKYPASTVRVFKSDGCAKAG